MKVASKLKKAIVLGMVTVMGTMMLQGCGEVSEEDMLASMKEFKTVDESVSIYLDEEWVVESVGMDNWLCAGNESGTEAFIVMQFPSGGDTPLATSMDDVVSLVETSYSYSGSEADAPEIPNMKNVKASKGKITMSGANIDGYVVYGETDYAYYAFLFSANNFDDDFLAQSKLSCTKFVETVPAAE